MKNLLYLFAFLFSAVNISYAQSSEEKINEEVIIIDGNWPEAPKTFIKERTTHGVYIATAGSYGRIGKSDLLQTDARLGYIADSKFDLSFVGSGLVSEKGIFDAEDNDEFLVAGMGGLQIEPILFGKQMVNISFPLFLGAGAAALTTDDNNSIFDCGPIDSDEWEPMFIAQPGVNAVFNITSFLQFELGAKYRLTSDLVFRDKNIGNLNGFNLGAGLKIGYFAFGKKRKHKHS